jgi:hypothetical protein
MKKKQPAPTPDQKQRMIAEAAYYRAEKRGFAGGEPDNDWFSAEAEIEESLNTQGNKDLRSQELAAYESMRREMKKLLANIQDTVNADTIKQAFDKAGKEIRGLGEFLPETVDKASKMLKNEIAATVERLGPRWESFSGKSAEIFEVWKDRGIGFLNQASGALNDWVGRYRKKR